jgi:hypothetical protein
MKAPLDYYTPSEALSPFCVYTIRHSDVLGDDCHAGGSGSFIERKRWVGAIPLLSAAQKAGQLLPVVFAAAESTDAITGVAFIDALDVSSPDERGNGTTTVHFSRLRPLREKHPLSWLRLKSTGKPLSDQFIRNYALCHTPAYLQPRENA